MMNIWEGPLDARIALIGEAPGEQEIKYGRPFVGKSGYILNEMLLASGLERGKIWIGNCTSFRPEGNKIENFFLNTRDAKAAGVSIFNGRYPSREIRLGLDFLFKMLSGIKPNLIITMGNTPLWALTGNSGIIKWRGSTLPTPYGKVLCTIHPADLFHQPAWRKVIEQDLRRAKFQSSFPEIPSENYEFLLSPSFEEVVNVLDFLISTPETPIGCDTETTYGQISCLGIAWNKRQAICIPFIRKLGEEGYFSFEEELEIIRLIKKLFSLRKTIWHNSLYDFQFTAKQWGFIPLDFEDTMLMQHTSFPGMIGSKLDPLTGAEQKTGSSQSLRFISSMYCENYRYWKDDGKIMDIWKGEMEKNWHYNCEDCVRCLECYPTLANILKSRNLSEQYEFQKSLVLPTLKMMFRGLPVSKKAHKEVKEEVEIEIESEIRWIETAVGHPFNPNSSQQMKSLFYSDLCCQPYFDRKTKAMTLNDKALERIKKKYPLLKPLVAHIERYRSLCVLRSNFLSARVSRDNRMRFGINITGTETFRFSSSENAFGEGTNMQNIPKIRD